MGRSYKLFSSATATTNAASSLRVTGKSRFRCINVSACGQAGAAIDGHFIVEISKQNVGSPSTNDTPSVVLATVHGSAPVNAGAFHYNASFVCDLPADVGDTIYLNFYRGGTAPVTNLINATLFTD